jgi:hydrogenase-4 component F
VGVEATTLASAPLIYFHRQHRSLEAAWKYLLVCSVGIGLALVGTLFLAAAAEGISEEAASLRLDDLLVHARELRVVWLEGAFLLLLVGYGTKMGLAPMHTWLPDAHSESPSLVSALLSGALLNCAFLGILRVHQVLVAAGAAELASGPLVAIGLISMATAAVFVVAQPDFKRMLAYSSVEHMGVLALGVGLGGPAVAGALLHAAAHSFTKATLFLSAGNLMAVYLTKRAADVRGALARTPRTAALWIAGLLAITGVPPFGLFVSEFAILRGALAGGQLAVAAIYLLLLAAVFVAMIGIGLPMAFGAVPGRPAERESWSATAPPAALALVALLLGVHQPLALRRLLEDAARLLGAP